MDAVWIQSWRQILKSTRKEPFACIIPLCFYQMENLKSEFMNPNWIEKIFRNLKLFFYLCPEINKNAPL